MKFRHVLKKQTENINPSDKSVVQLYDIPKKEKPNVQMTKLGYVLCSLCFVFVITAVVASFPANRNIPITNNGNAPVSQLDGTSPKASDYSDIFTKLSEIKNNNIYKNDTMIPSPEWNGSVTGDTGEGRPETAPADDNIDYSDTNLQVAGVQEADIIKTDGKYFYVISSESIFIISVSELSIVSSIERTQMLMSDTKEHYSIKEASNLFVCDDYLVVISSANNNNNSWRYYANDCIVDIYDISMREQPELISTFSQNGTVVSTRMIGNVLYTVTNYDVITEISANNINTFIPSFTQDGECLYASPESIFVSETTGMCCYTVATSIVVNKTPEYISNINYVGTVSAMYMNSDSLVFAAFSTSDKKHSAGKTEYKQITDIYRYSIDNGMITYTSRATVDGYLLNQFSMDINKGYLRIVTSVSTYSYNDSVSSGREYNNVYIISEDGTITGKIEGLAETERIYSVRFDGDIAYFVTYRQMDPLFAADLSVPSNPKILSALKIPGFSTYLHVYGKDMLFGIGYDDNWNVKLSMFDISDKTDVTELSTLSLDVGYSEALYNHKAIMVSPERNMIGIPTSNGFMLISFTDGKFNVLINEKLDEWYEGRVVYIDNRLFYLNAQYITSYDLSTNEITDKLSFQDTQKDYIGVSGEDGIIVTKGFIENNILSFPTEVDGKKVIGVWLNNCNYYCGSSMIEPDYAIDPGYPDYVYNEYINITQIILPEGIRYILNDSFGWENGNVESVTLPSSLVFIGSNAFTGMYKLNSIELPEKLVTLGANAFVNTCITEIELPDSIEYFGNRIDNTNYFGPFPKGCSITVSQKIADKFDFTIFNDYKYNIIIK